jgi:hypothetical protein
MSNLNLSIVSRSIFATRAAVTAGPKVSLPTRTAPEALSGAIGALIIVPPIKKTVLHPAKPRGRTGMESDQAVVIVSLGFLRCNQMASIEDY